jgi:GH18 family chitinase
MTVYTVYETDQWVSYDNEQSWQAKLEYLNSKCMAGLMIWSIDEDTENYAALSALLGDDVVSSNLLTGGESDHCRTG